MKEQKHDVSKDAVIEYLSAFITASRLAKMKKVMEDRTRRITVVLEDIFQSQNTSAVLRSCECFGIQDVHIVENRYQFEVNPDVVMGASKWLSLFRYQGETHNTAACLNALKEKGYVLVATSPHKKGFTPDTLPLTEKIALIFGTEMEGLSHEAKKMADVTMHIPMLGFTESFNISVSVALALYRLSSRLRLSPGAWDLPETERKELLLEWMSKSVRDSEMLIRHFLEREYKP